MVKIICLFVCSFVRLFCSFVSYISETATEGDEEDLKALELRKQEVRLQPQRHHHRQDTDTGSDTEVRNFQSSSSSSFNPPIPEKKNVKNCPSGSSVRIGKDGVTTENGEDLKNIKSQKSLQRSVTFAEGRHFRDGRNPLIKSKSVVTDSVTDFKSSAPFEEKLNMFGARTRGERKSSNLEMLLRKDMNGNQKWRRENVDVDDEKYIDKNLVMRRESLKKTNSLDPKTLEFQTKINSNDFSDKGKFNFLVVKRFSPSPPPHSPVVRNFSQNGDLNDHDDDRYSSFRALCENSESDVEEFFKNLTLKEEEMEKLAEKFNEVTQRNRIALPAENIKIDVENVTTIDSDIEEFFDNLNLEKELESKGGGEVTEKDVEEILNLFDDDGNDKSKGEGVGKGESNSVEEMEKHFENLLKEVEAEGGGSETLSGLINDVEEKDDERGKNKSNGNAEDGKTSPEINDGPTPSPEPSRKIQTKDENICHSYENVFVTPTPPSSPPVRPRRKKDNLSLNIMETPVSDGSGVYDNYSSPEKREIDRSLLNNGHVTPETTSKNHHYYYNPSKYDTKPITSHSSINRTNLDRARWNARRNSSGGKETDVRRSSVTSPLMVTTPTFSHYRDSRSISKSSPRSPKYDDDKCLVS
ncbi:conserved hypothetical protein [Pediculus humanus corporis]|uniref:Uncharacterized protein n=1 Tax=Pediculus humanus subsp. corporis TaxID=121224 RepID=E0VEE9_PEDHC|nr:uncharacterized protein Phum_PHUM131570 [Pediculus humanus corporis]EEB11755.1 conserved hypothetical protein [Pediculus humanus corporis]